MDYSDFKLMALEMISDFGNSGEAVFTRNVVTNVNPLNSRGTVVPETARALVVVPPETDQSREEARALGWDIRMLIPATGFEPQPGDHVTLPGRSGTFIVIVPVEKAAPDGDAIYFTVRARII